MSNNDVSSFFGGTGIPSAKFPTIGTVVTGTITEPPVQSQQSEIGTGKPLTWDDGKPRMQLVITLQTDERDPEIEGDTGIRRVFVTGTAVAQGGGMKGAFQRAGIRDLPVGGKLTIKYTHDGQRSSAAYSPPKQYEVTFVAPNPTAGFLGGAKGSASNGMPRGMDPDVWNNLTPEVQAELKTATSV